MYVIYLYILQKSKLPSIHKQSNKIDSDSLIGGAAYKKYRKNYKVSVSNRQS